ncbi:MAG: hypothetical protein JSR39_06120, partial [Verrucomicrobia bacterium]|nr:hypothetical protein [Verrucomicrobiota bacterium]
MNNKWLILLMTPLFTYASYENDGWEDQDSFNHAVVIEEEAPYMDDYSELYVEAIQEDFVEENEVVSAPVVSKRSPQKRNSTQSQAASSSKRIKDIRQNSNRPRVTHRDRDEVKAVESQENTSGQQFVSQENEIEAQQVSRQPARQANRQRAARSEAPVLEQETAAEETQERRQPARQANRQRAARSEAPVLEQETAAEEQQVRRQPARQASQQRSARSEAPVRKQEAAAEEQQVRRQPARQASQQRAARSEAPVRKQEAAAEEQQVRRQPARQASQQRAARSEAPVRKQEAA